MKTAPTTESHKGRKRVSLADAVREFLIGSGLKKFTAIELRDALVVKKPEIADKAADLATNLINMASRGELIRDASVKPVIYTVARLKLPGGDQISDKEAAYRQFRAEMSPPVTQP